MQVRGEGERVKSLNVRGEEICRVSVQFYDTGLGELSILGMVYCLCIRRNMAAQS